jgi:hypothetical protein
MALFRLTTRHRGRLPEGWTELELLPGLTIENVWATGITWEEFRRFLQGKIVWMTTNVYLCYPYLYGSVDPWVLVLEGDGHNKLFVHVMEGADAEVVTATCHYMVRLLATCEHHGVSIGGRHSNTVPSPLSGAALSLFFQESRSCLRQVTLDYIALSGDQCRALATMSRLDVELRIHNCKLADDAAGAFVECLHSDRGPVELHHCNIDSQILASALSGNSRVTKLKTHYPSTNDAGTAVLVAALANNRGLEELDLEDVSISDDNWSILCESLKAHPTLTNLNLRNTRPRFHDNDDNDDDNDDADDEGLLADEQNTHRTRLLAETMQENTVLHTIALSEGDYAWDQQIYTEEISPYLETNLYRPRVVAVKKTIERPFREKVLGRALGCVKSNPNLVWMFLSENVDAFVRSEEEEEGNSEVPVAAAAAAPVVVGVAVSVAGSKRKL